MTISSVNNYLVPAVGTPSAEATRTVLDGNTITRTYRATNVDGANFIPTGVYNSSDSATDVTLTFSGLENFTINVPIGKGVNYPALADQEISINGFGEVCLVFVNYPIIS